MRERGENLGNDSGTPLTPVREIEGMRRMQLRGRVLALPGDVEPEIDLKNTTLMATSPDWSSDPVRQYLSEINAIPLLTPEQEISLTRNLRQVMGVVLGPERVGDVDYFYNESDDSKAIPQKKQISDALRADSRYVEAVNALVRPNLRLVVSIAKKYQYRGLSLLELIQEGNIGLTRGVEKFDCNTGNKLSTYATFWIKQAITRAIADTSRVIRLPVHINDDLGRIKEYQTAKEQDSGREPTPDEIELATGITKEQQLLIDNAIHLRSLDAPIYREDGQITLGEAIQIGAPDFTPEVELNRLREEVAEALQILSPRQRRIIELRMGFVGGRVYTLEEVGKEFGVTRERIRQIETTILLKLQESEVFKKMREYLE